MLVSDDLHSLRCLIVLQPIIRIICYNALVLFLDDFGVVPTLHFQSEVLSEHETLRVKVTMTDDPAWITIVAMLGGSRTAFHLGSIPESVLLGI